MLTNGAATTPAGESPILNGISVKGLDKSVCPDTETVKIKIWLTGWRWRLDIPPPPPNHVAFVKGRVPPEWPYIERGLLNGVTNSVTIPGVAVINNGKQPHKRRTHVWKVLLVEVD